MYCINQLCLFLAVSLGSDLVDWIISIYFISFRFTLKIWKNTTISDAAGHTPGSCSSTLLENCFYSIHSLCLQYCFFPALEAFGGCAVCLTQRTGSLSPTVLLTRWIFLSLGWLVLMVAMMRMMMMSVMEWWIWHQPCDNQTASKYYWLTVIAFSLRSNDNLSP